MAGGRELHKSMCNIWLDGHRREEQDCMISDRQSERRLPNGLLGMGTGWGIFGSYMNVQQRSYSAEGFR